jgi:high-affinity nickel-transport protein
VTRDVKRLLTRAEWLSLSVFAGGIGLLHVLGWGLFALSSRGHPSLAGLGVLAYTLGLRHAFDADHIAAIDNATRKLVVDGKPPLGVGFFFSLGHSTIVFMLSAGLAVAGRTLAPSFPALQTYGGAIGAGVSGTFLWIIGLVNLLVLLDVLRLRAATRRGSCDHERLDRRMLDRGLLSRVLSRRFARIESTWQMYPLGALFGLGLDTASEVALLALGAGVGVHHIPVLGILSLPLLFAAGMSLMDTADGVVMSRAYGWASASPARRIHYNLTITGLSVAVALLVGTIELLQLAARGLGPSGGLPRVLTALDLGRLGYGIAALSVLTWAIAAIVWTARRSAHR